MSSKKSFLILGIIVLILFLSIGYAVVSSVYIKTGGTASVSDSELNVEITNTVASTSVSGKTVDFTHVLSNKNLTSKFTLNGMELNEVVSIVYTVTNNEIDVDAILSMTSDGVILNYSNSKYFDVDFDILDSTTDLANGDKIMIVEIKVKLVKTPVSEDGSSTTVELTLNASPLGTTSESTVTPLKFGEKYYIISLIGSDTKKTEWWISFDENGHLTQDSKYGISNSITEGYSFTKTSIINDSKVIYDISPGGQYLISKDSHYGHSYCVIEEKYNEIKSMLFQFGVDYICTTDNVNSEDNSILGTKLRIYPDGSVDVIDVLGNYEQLSSGTIEYTENEIYSSGSSDGDKFIISDDGMNISYMRNGEVLYVFTNRYVS